METIEGGIGGTISHWRHTRHIASHRLPHPQSRMEGNFNVIAMKLEMKTPLRVPPPEVAEYLANEGMQYIRPRPYEYLKTSMAVTHSLYENTPSDKA